MQQPAHEGALTAVLEAPVKRCSREAGEVPEAVGRSSPPAEGTLFRRAERSA